MKGFIVVAGITFLLDFGRSTFKGTPGKVYVFIDRAQGEYMSPACVPTQQWATTDRLLMRQASQLHLRPNDKCRDVSVLIQEGRSITGIFLEFIGVLPSLKSRWNADGSWNW